LQVRILDLGFFGLDLKLSRLDLGVVYEYFILKASSLFSCIYIRRRGLSLLEYGDVLIWGLPWGCGVGRLGCFFIHDHPGTLTHFVLGVRHQNGEVRHDLGLYLSLIGFVTGILFLFLNRRPRRPGFWWGTYMLIEGLVRFGLDFLRLNDTRYLGLTPTQYLALPLALGGIWLIRRAR
jgi:phosphatidylglycerol:prolipoprotein diacylglycerol transferase